MTDPTADDPNPPSDPVPDPPPAPRNRTAFHDVLWFLEQCRLHQYAVQGPIKYGEMVVQVIDMRHGMGQAMPPDEGPWAAAGWKGDE